MNLGEHLLACAERHPEALAIVDGEQRATYAELLALARSAAGGLGALGVGPGDRVAAALKNRIETAVLYWATQWLGAVFVPLNWRLRPDELTYCVGDCGARVLAIEGASAEACRGRARHAADRDRRCARRRAAWHRRHSRASSGHATTVSSTRSPKSASGKLLRRLLRTTEGPHDGYDGFRVARETDRGVATITLDVPEKFNRVSMGARDELAQVFARAGGDEGVRVVVLRGAGDQAFTAGGDVGMFMSATRRRSRPARQRGRPERCPSRDRPAARLLLRRRAGARAGLRLPRRERRRAARLPELTLG